MHKIYMITLSMVVIWLMTAVPAPAASAAPAPTGATTVLLPTIIEPVEIHITPDGAVEIHITPDGAASCLTFDLSDIPKGLTSLSVELRLVGYRAGGDRPQLVNVYQADGNCKEPAESLGFWRVPEPGDRLPPYRARVESSIELEDGEGGLATTIHAAIGGELKLLLRTESNDSDWKYASLETSYGFSADGELQGTYKPTDEEFRSSQKPRLILRYEAPAGAPAVSTDTSHRAFGVPPSVVREKVSSFTNIVSGPLLYQNALIVIAKTAEETTEVVALSPYSTELWKCPIQGQVGETTDVTIASQLRRHSVIDGEGRLYNFGAKAVTIYDLKGRCPEGGQFPSDLIPNPGSIAPQAPPTIAAGDNLFLAGEGENNYVYGLTPGSFQELWRSEARVGTLAGRLAVSPPDLECEPDANEQNRAACRGIVYALTPELLRLDAATGTALDPLDKWVIDEHVDADWKPYSPLVATGTEDDRVVLAATGITDGLLTAFSGDKEAWAKKGPVAAQPALAQDDTGPVVLTIQNKRFQRLSLDTGEGCESEEIKQLVCAGPGCTSNLVPGANGQTYFLHTGVLYGYDDQCGPLFAVDVENGTFKGSGADATQQSAQQSNDAPQKTTGQPTERQMVFGSDGTLYAHDSNTGALFALIPSYTLPTAQSIISSPTHLRVDGTVDKPTTLAAGGNIILGSGFTVTKGSTLKISTKPCSHVNIHIIKSNRYVDCGNGTVADTVTGKLWLKKADCFGTYLTYAAATTAAAALEHGDKCGLKDNSSPGDWHLPTQDEWETTLAQARSLNCQNPSLTNTAGTDCYANGLQPFTGVQSDTYWTSTIGDHPDQAHWVADLRDGKVQRCSESDCPPTNQQYVWPVRDEQ